MWRRRNSTWIFALARTAMLAGLGLGVAAMAVVGYERAGLRGLELRTFDVRAQIRGERPAPRDLIIVAIDDQTLQRLGGWPLRRRVHARVLARLAAARPRAIAFDIQFTERGPFPADDLRLAEAVRAAGNVVLATTESGARLQPTGRLRASTTVLGGDDQLRRHRARAASTRLARGPGDTVRSFPYHVDGLVSLPVATVERARGTPVRRYAFTSDGALYGNTGARLGGDTALVDFRGPAGTVRAVPYWRVLERRFSPGLVRDGIVVVAAVAPALRDFVDTPFGEMSGGEAQANAIATVLDGFPLRDSGTALDVALIVALGLLAPLAALALRPLWLVVLALSVAVAYGVGAQLAFEAGTVLPVVWPLTALGLGLAVATPGAYVAASFERARALFGRYVPAAVVERELARGGRGPRLGGELLEATVMFADLRGFTAFAETLPPDRVIEVLNRYLGEMGDCILDHHGTIVAFSGDGIMAVFGAPDPLAGHADAALAAAREMSTVRLGAFNAWLQRAHGADAFRMGVGLNSGPVVSGHVGTDRRLEYTCIGDTTNTAARLEVLTKRTGHLVLLSESTRSALAHAPAELVALGDVDLPGRRTAVTLWALDGAGPAARPATTPRAGAEPG